jgi:hypothetical protein
MYVCMCVCVFVCVCVIQVIGEGSFAVVKECRNIATGGVFAVKILANDKTRRSCIQVLNRALIER